MRPRVPAAAARLAAVALALLAAAPARADGGRITGTITLTRPNATAKASQPSTDAGAVVYLVGFTQRPPKKVAVMYQKHEAFHPSVLAITKGQTVAFPNLDTERHNVFSVSPARHFDLGLTPPGARPTIHFDRTGLVNVYCNIHPQMAGTILVLPNRAFAVTGAKGHFAIDHVPPGTYTLYAWHPLADPIREQVTVTADQTVKVSLVLPLTHRPKPHMNKYGRPYKKHPHY